MEEIWKDIEGYEGRYQVSNLGRVRSLDIILMQPNPHNGVMMPRRRTGKILKLLNGTTGYKMVCLSEGFRKFKTKSVHRLVAKAFIPNPLNLEFINHKNEIKTDNRIDNLEWCTRIYNVRYGTAQKRRSISRSRRVEQLDLNGNIIATHYGMNEAERNTGIRTSSIWKCCSGRQHTACGYRWRYADE